MKIGIIHSQVRKEEKLIIEELNRRGITFDSIDDRQAIFTLNDSSYWEQYDAILERCVSNSRAISILNILNNWGIPTVNTAQAAGICSDKLATNLAFNRFQIPTPEVRIAFTPESALLAIEEIGYPVVLKPTVGSWGRLLSKINDREAAETVVEHKSTLGSVSHSIFYIQEFIDKPGRDIRTFVVGDETICGITRSSNHWITNTARGGSADNFPITPEIDQLSRAAAQAVGGGVLAIDILESHDGRYLVNEVNYTMEFRNSIAPTGVNIPGRIVDYIISVANS
jgi:[lysine-biosynthesis-protein LysW]---L-2-aminoadipate ligase